MSHNDDGPYPLVGVEEGIDKPACDNNNNNSLVSWKRRKRQTKHCDLWPTILIFIALVTLTSATSPSIPQDPQKSTDTSIQNLHKDSDEFLSEPFLIPPSAEELDEENDEKLFNDILNSLQEWHRIKEEKERRKQDEKHRYRRDEEFVCYGDLGCFRDEGAFDYLNMLPSPPEEINTKMWLYTKLNRELPQFLDYNNATQLKESNFNATLPTKLIIHGFGSGCNRVWPREMRLSLLAVESCNVVCVDWANGAVDPNYVRAAVNTRLVGKQVALFLKLINEVYFVDINPRTHLIGFSLGAHVAGFAGSELKNLSRITGLDPAGPLFEGYEPRVRLDKTDANYVDVIHSNGESLIVGGFGVWEPIGHVDFYPNGGRAQRGCQHLIIGGLYDFIYSYSSSNETYRYLCNHRRAYKLFTNSISPKCTFRAFPCESYEHFEAGKCFSCSSSKGPCGELGYYSDKAPGRGSLYLLTRDNEPFCGNQYKINIMFTSTRVPIHTYGRIQILLVDKDGLNETHPVTNDVDDLLTSGTQVEKLLVVHPAIIPVEAHILYVAYEGWIYSGRFQWSLDKLVLTDSEGQRKSFCKKHGKLLPSGLPVKLKMSLGDCVGASLNHPEYPIRPFKPYPKVPPEPYGHLGPPPKQVFKPLKDNKLKSSHGQDVLYLSNSVQPAGVASSSQEKGTIVIDINDDVAPESIPEIHTFVSTSSDVHYDLGPAYTVDKHVTKTRPLKKPVPRHPSVHHYHIVKGSKPQRVSLKPTVSTSSLPISQGRPLTVQLPPKSDDFVEWSNSGEQFPSRARPSTSQSSDLPLSLHSLSSHLIPPPPPPPTLSPPSTLNNQSNLFVSSGFKDKPGSITNSSSELSSEIEIVHDKNETTLEYINQPVSVSNATKLSMQMITDDQLTIVKFGNDSEEKQGHNDPNSDNPAVSSNQNENSAGKKHDYIVLHKLPNGEALNLENLQTYSMADIANGRMPEVNYDSGVYFEMGDAPNERPRSLNVFDVSEGSDELQIDKNVGMSPEERFQEYYGGTLPPPEELVISERPYVEPEPYEPKPLEELNDLVAMADISDANDEGSRTRTSQSKDQRPSNYENHPYYTNFEYRSRKPTKVKPPNANRGREIPNNTTTVNNNFSTTESNKTSEESVKDVETASSEKPLETTTNHSLFNSPATTDGSEWIPIETETASPRPTYGPVYKPKDYESSTIGTHNIQKLHDIAEVKVGNVGASDSEDFSRVDVNKDSVDVEGENMQILPPKLTSVIAKASATASKTKDRSLDASHKGHVYRGDYAGQFRENKIAPVFKQSYQHRPRSLHQRHFRPSRYPPHHPHFHRVPKRLPHPLGQQVIPQVDHSRYGRYIPLQRRRRPILSRLWWQASRFVRPTTLDSMLGGPSLTRGDFSVNQDDISYEERPSSEEDEQTGEEEKVGRVKTLQEEELGVGTNEETSVLSHKIKIVRMQKPFVSESNKKNKPLSELETDPSVSNKTEALDVLENHTESTNLSDEDQKEEPFDKEVNETNGEEEEDDDVEEGIEDPSTYESVFEE